jgi:hypothetical protein
MRPVAPEAMRVGGMKMGKNQRKAKTMTAMNFIRSAEAPKIRTGVMIAKGSWKVQKKFCKIRNT